MTERTREQGPPGDLHYLFSPLKHARLDYMVQKAVEMGVSHLQPVIMQHTQAERVNLARMKANAIEAAEQCGILAIPEIGEPRKLDALVRAWKPDRLLVFCDEAAEVKDPVAALVVRARWRHRGTAAGERADRSGRRLRRARNVKRCSSCRTPCASRSARVSCAPTRLALRPSPSFRQRSATGVRVAVPRRSRNQNRAAAFSLATCWPGIGPVPALLRPTPAGFSRRFGRVRKGRTTLLLARERWTMSDDYKFGIEEEYFLVDAETKSVAREMPGSFLEKVKSASADRCPARCFSRRSRR